MPHTEAKKDVHHSVFCGKCYCSSFTRHGFLERSARAPPSVRNALQSASSSMALLVFLHTASVNAESKNKLAYVFHCCGVFPLMQLVLSRCKRAGLMCHPCTAAALSTTPRKSALCRLREQADISVAAGAAIFCVGFPVHNIHLYLASIFCTGFSARNIHLNLIFFHFHHYSVRG